MNKKSAGFRIFAYTFLSLFAMMNIVPLFWMVVNSFKNEQEYAANPFSLPGGFAFLQLRGGVEGREYERIFSEQPFRHVCVLDRDRIFRGLASYFLSRFQFKLRGITYGVFLLGMLVPIHATLIPIFLIMQKLHLLDTHLSLILPYTAFHLSLTIIILEGFMRGFPKDLEESGVMDGAGIFRIFWSIILPITRPAMATVVILNFIYNWNEYLFALVLISSSALKTLPLGLANFVGIETASLTLQMAALTMALIPIIIFYLLLQKQLVTGMTAGAVKG
ncbi:sugar ABC transporter permease [Paenibacillus sp. HMSSN-139]|nr:sugar ABC transporter permease [Paenibacillus sp. HMSSN-139]